jgi:hypothetical protein
MSFMSKDSMTVQIDHRCIFRGNPRYPKNITEPLSQCSIGERFDGQMAPIYVFHEPVSQSTSAILATHHASNTKLMAIDLVSLPVSDTPPLRTAHLQPAGDWGWQDPTPLGLTSKAFSSKLLLVYHPDRCASQMCLDLHGGKHGMMARATRVWALDCARDVIASIGGVAALFPLFYLVLIADGEHKRTQGPAQLAKQRSGQEDEALLYRSDSDADREKHGWLSLLLSILARMLRAHEVNQKEMYRIGGKPSVSCTTGPWWLLTVMDGPTLNTGIEMLEHVIAKTPPEVMRAEDIDCCVRSVLELCNCSAGAGYPALETQMIRRLLQPNLWRRTSVDFQLQILQAQVGFVRSSPARFRDIIHVGSLLDTIRDHYSTYVPEPPPKVAPVAGMGTKRLTRGESAMGGAAGQRGQGRKPPEQQQPEGNPSLIRLFRSSTFSQATGDAAEETIWAAADREALRRTTFQIIICLCQDAVTEKELRPLLQFLASFMEKESDLAEEVLQVLLYLLQQEAPPAGLFETIDEIFHSAQSFAAFIILGVVNREVDQLRATGIRVLNAYLMRDDSDAGSAGHRKTVSRVRGPIDRFLANGGSTFLWHYLNQHVHTIDEYTYAALLEMVLASRDNFMSLPMFSRPTILNNALVPSTLQPTKIIDDLDEIRNVTVLTIIMKLLPSLAHHLKERAYGDLLLLLKFSERNRVAFVTVAGWQVHLFELMAPFIIRGEESGGVMYEPGQRVFSLIRSTPFEDEGYVSTYGSRLSRGESPGSLQVNGRRRSVQFDQEVRREEQSDDWSGPPGEESGGGVPQGEARHTSVTMDDGEGTRASSRPTSGTPPPSPLGWDDPEAARDLSVDHWIDMGMKLYVLLLMHVLEKPNGWTEVARALSLEKFVGQGHLVLIALCSQLLVEINSDIKFKVLREAQSPTLPTFLQNIIQSTFLISTFLTANACNVVTLTVQGLDIPLPTTTPAVQEVVEEDDVMDAPSEPLATTLPSPRSGGGMPGTAMPHSASSPTMGSRDKSMAWGRRSASFGGAGARGHRTVRSAQLQRKATWAELCNGSGRTKFFNFPSYSAVFGRRVSERSGTVLVATQILQLLDILFQHACSGSSAGGSAPMSPLATREPPEAIAFVQQDGGHPSSGPLAVVILRLSLFVLNTVHPIHPLAMTNTARYAQWLD